MIKNISLSLLALVFLAGCVEDIESTNDYVSEESHNQGAQCLTCHGIGGSEASEDLFTSGATVYTTIDGVASDKYASNYTVRLVLENTSTQINYRAGYGTGNSNTNYSNSINYYSAQVVDGSGNVVNSSLVNSHDAGRLDCNTCHTAAGTDGAPGRITSYDYYAINSAADNNTTTRFFSTNVMPILDAKCKSCHGTDGDFTITNTSSTYNNINTYSFVDTANVNSSLLLTKGSGSNHPGGTIISTTSTDYVTIKDWITQGALNN